MFYYLQESIIQTNPAVINWNNDCIEDCVKIYRLYVQCAYIYQVVMHFQQV